MAVPAAFPLRSVPAFPEPTLVSQPPPLLLSGSQVSCTRLGILCGKSPVKLSAEPRAPRPALCSQGPGRVKERLGEVQG